MSSHKATEVEEGVFESVAVINNGAFGTREVRFETGLLARQAAGSVAAYLDEETMLLSATAAGKHPREGFDFFPLTVDVEERMYAAGRIPGGFFKRERGATERETLVSRLIDRPVRPLFPEGFYNEINCIAQVLSYDGENEPERWVRGRRGTYVETLLAAEMVSHQSPSLTV